MRGIVLRVDDRLIHGQILYGWVQGWPADRVYLVNDRIADDPVEREIYAELLSGVREGSILTIDSAITLFAGLSPTEERILLVLETCADLVRLLQGGVKPVEAHLGNLAGKEGSRAVSPDVSLGPEDVNALETATRLGCTVTIRDLPSSTPVEVGKALEEKGK